MSLLRGTRFPAAAAGRKPSKARRKKPPVKQEWDGTVHDLTVHRATPEELVRRHEMHKSKNKAQVRLELQEKALKSTWKKQRPRVPESLEKKKLALMREILSDQYHLQDVLERSDRAMAVVKDLFGDAPRRHLGFPNVTVAPDCDVESTQGPIMQKCDVPTQLSILSESVMDPQALNEVGESSSDFPLEGENVQEVSFNSRSSTDINRVLCLPKEKISVGVCQEKAIKLQANTASSQDASMLATPEAGLPSLDCAALNATNVVKRVHSRLENEEQIADITYIVQQVLNANLKKQKQISAKVKKTQTVLMPTRQKRSHLSAAAAAFSPPSGRVSNLDILNQMIHDVEQQMEEYELWTGQEVQQAPNGHHGLSGFTYSLVNALSRVMHYLKESEARLRQEALNRQQLEGEVSEQRALIDALTAEILLVREENLALQTKLQQYMFVTDEQLTSLTRALKGLPTSESNRMRSPGETGGLSVRSPEAVQGKPFLNYVGLTTDIFSGERMSEHSQRDLPSKGPVLPSPPNSAGVGQNLSAPVIQPVVLLTPPQQKNSQAPLPFQDESTGRQSAQEDRSSVPGKAPIMLQDGALFPQRGRFPIATGAPQSFLQPDGQPVKSAFSAVARPGLGGFAERLNPGPPRMCVQDEDLQGQIAELTFQNSVIRAQLSKFQQSHQEAGDRLEQPSPTQNTSGKEEQETNQAVSSLKEPPKSLDERIAELNHQSAEARSRLLQLISQQKLAMSVSPPISPIPSPPVNLSKTGRRKIEVSVPVAETLDSSKEDSPSATSGTNTRRCSGASSQRSLPQSATLGNAPLIAETHRRQAEQQREEGWFALSMHTG
ncbi:spindle and centriole-associated protein 1 [Eublepharis macularius]|uniref:Spindle and centriole-associated protein 1 n=1 Tax=Eublepharis macularius TaxID=481883 RepID=A0AA97LJZ7_EUBMA|nr:spindle and centriole-associated protein 1 [Eublepharis macularius]